MTAPYRWLRQTTQVFVHPASRGNAGKAMARSSTHTFSLRQKRGGAHCLQPFLFHSCLQVSLHSCTQNERHPMKVTKRKRRILLIPIGMLCLCILLCLSRQLCQRKTPPVPEAPIETQPEPALTLESLLGEDYVQFVTDTD